MSYRSLALAAAVAAFSWMQIESAAAQSVYVAPGGIYVAPGAGPVYVARSPAPINRPAAYVEPGLGYAGTVAYVQPDYDDGYAALAYAEPGYGYGYGPDVYVEPRYGYGYGPRRYVAPRYGYDTERSLHIGVTIEENEEPMLLRFRPDRECLCPIELVGASAASASSQHPPA
jgi:hypothetical protein